MQEPEDVLMSLQSSYLKIREVQKNLEEQRQRLKLQAQDIYRQICKTRTFYLLKQQVLSQVQRRKLRENSDMSGENSVTMRSILEQNSELDGLKFFLFEQEKQISIVEKQNDLLKKDISGQQRSRLNGLRCNQIYQEHKEFVNQFCESSFAQIPESSHLSKGTALKGGVLSLERKKAPQLKQQRSSRATL